MNDYYRLIAGVDELVGTVMEKLEGKHLTENTIIIFTSDNGFSLGDRGLAGKWFMYEESIRVPACHQRPAAAFIGARPPIGACAQYRFGPHNSRIGARRGSPANAGTFACPLNRGKIDSLASTNSSTSTVFSTRRFR